MCGVHQSADKRQLNQEYYKLIRVFFNIIELIRILIERGNWKLIRHSRNQLKDFILCRSGLNNRPAIEVLFYWFRLLRGSEVLIWRLETFGYLFTSKTDQKARDYLNSYL